MRKSNRFEISHQCDFWPDSPGGEGGYRHPTREFTGIGDFGQFRGADSEFRCYTEN